MPSPKKPKGRTAAKPRFGTPDDIEAELRSGWVKRSDQAPAAKAEAAPAASPVVAAPPAPSPVVAAPAAPPKAPTVAAPPPAAPAPVAAPAARRKEAQPPPATAAARASSPVATPAQPPPAVPAPPSRSRTSAETDRGLLTATLDVIAMPIELALLALLAPFGSSEKRP